MSRAPATLVAIAAVVVSAVVAAAPSRHVWKAYVNVRYGYSVCFPADLMTPAPEAPNGDGRRFAAPGGATLLAYGSNNVLAASVPEAARQAGERLGHVSYSVLKPGWFVVSGSKGATDFYAKSLFRGDQVKSFELTYPHAAAATWKPVAAALNACFHSTP